MSDIGDFCARFWSGFCRAGPDPDWFGEGHRIKNGNPGYAEFVARLGHGFRPVGALSRQRGVLSAQSCTTNAGGRETIRALVDGNGGNPALVIEGRPVRLHECRTNEKAEVRRENAWLEDSDLWPVHCRWLCHVVPALCTRTNALLESRHA